jgi:uncharacterized protein
VPPDDLPLFPLSNVVLFPGCLAPLRVFEPRYRQMTADALEGGRAIGMVTVRPDFVEEMEGDPPVYDVGCAGFITEHQQLADGRYHLVLRGTHRFRILHEPPRDPGRLYRVAEVERLSDAAVEDAARTQPLRRSVIGRLREIARRSTDAEGHLPIDQLGTLDDGTFTNTLCQALGLPAAEKQGLLEAPDVAERLVRLDGLLAFHLAVIRGPASSPRAVH